MASVKLTNVKKIYGKNTVAVQDFNLEIKDREFVVFVGPSGCGKSTTLRMIAGLEDISEGTVEIGGTVVNDLQPKDRGIAMVFQNYALYPNLTVFENIAFPLRLIRVPVKETDETESAGEGTNEAPNEAEDRAHSEVESEVSDGPAVEATNEETPEAETGKKKKRRLFGRRKKERAAEGEEGAETGETRYRKLTREEITERVMNAAEMLGIKEYLLRRPKELSGGQRQRVAIGRAIVRDSKVLLLDEPLSNLDAKLRNQMRAEFILLHKKIDATFIYVTHDQTEAMTLGDRIVIMKDGFIQQVGTPTEVFDMPNNLFVAEFIGSPKMNTFKTRLECDESGYYVSPCGVRMPVDGEKGEALKAKGAKAQDIILGVRPEHVSLTRRDNPAAIPCTIQVNEMMGSELHLHVLTPQEEQMIVRVPTVSLDAKQLALLRAGVKIFVTFRSKVMHFFNAETNYNLLTDEVPKEDAEEAQVPDMATEIATDRVEA